MKSHSRHTLLKIACLVVFCLSLAEAYTDLPEEGSTRVPVNYPNEYATIIAECCDIVAYLILLGIYEYKTRTHPWSINRIFFRVLTGMKIFDDVLHMLPSIWIFKYGYDAGFILSSFSLILTSVIRGLLLFANIRYILGSEFLSSVESMFLGLIGVRTSIPSLDCMLLHTMSSISW